MTQRSCGAVVLLALAACQPLPPRVPPDAGLAELRGVRLVRQEQDRVVLTVEAPRATLALDGDRVVLDGPRGTWRASPDAGDVALEAAQARASLVDGTAVAVGARATDAQGRSLSSPRVFLGADASVVLADGPVTLSGSNVSVRAEGGARLDVATEVVELLGPVEGTGAPSTDRRDGGRLP